MVGEVIPKERPEDSQEIITTMEKEVNNREVTTADEDRLHAGFGMLMGGTVIHKVTNTIF